jgi:hypothetical protein
MNASLVTSSDVSCFGGENGYIQIVVSGGTLPYQFSWNTFPIQTTPFASNLSEGQYQCVITDAANCQITFYQTITEPFGSVPIINGPQTTEQDSTASYSIDIYPNCEINWNIQNGVIVADLNNEIDVLWNNIGLGQIQVIVIDTINGCEWTDNLQVEIATGIHSTLNSNDFSIFPNPTNKMLSVQGNRNLKNVEVLDCFGRLIFREYNFSSNKTFDFSHLANGVYFLRINEITKKFIKY